MHNLNTAWQAAHGHVQIDSQFCPWVLQINQKLKKAQVAVATAEAAMSGHEVALTEKERQKKWMKF